MKQKILHTHRCNTMPGLIFAIVFLFLAPDVIQAQSVGNFKDMAMQIKPENTNRFSPFISASQSAPDVYESGDAYDGFPVKLENFNGIYTNGFTKLGWNTLMEYNLGEFIVERSRTGSDYQEIGRVDAFGNTNNFSSYYTFMDISSERGSNFYRLKLVDKDSSVSYSRVIVINTEAREISLLLVFPNPFGRKVQAKIECEKPEKLTVRVINSGGQVVRTQYNDLRAGENIITVDNVADLPPGGYVLEMIAASRTMRTQIMKQ